MKKVYVIYDNIAIATTEEEASKGGFTVATADEVIKANRVLNSTQYDISLSQGVVFSERWQASLNQEYKDFKLTRELLNKIQIAILPNVDYVIEICEIMDPEENLADNWGVIISIPLQYHLFLEDDGFVGFEVEVHGKVYDIAIETP